MKAYITVETLSPKRFDNREVAAGAMDIVCNTSPLIIPVKYGSYEPIRTNFDPQNMVPFLDEFDYLIFWINRKNMLFGSMHSQGRHPRHGGLSIEVDATEPDIDGIMQFLYKSSVKLIADFAYLHITTETEWRDLRKTNTVHSDDKRQSVYSSTVTTWTLDKYIPQLYWATVFGPAYVRFFGKEKLLASPAYIVKELGDDMIYLQLSESPFDLIHKYHEVDSVRQKIKTHLDNNSFYDLNLPDDHVYNTPEFIYDPHLPPAQSSSTGQTNKTVETDSPEPSDGHATVDNADETVDAGPMVNASFDFIIFTPKKNKPFRLKDVRKRITSLPGYEETADGLFTYTIQGSDISVDLSLEDGFIDGMAYEFPDYPLAKIAQDPVIYVEMDCFVPEDAVMQILDEIYQAASALDAKIYDQQTDEIASVDEIKKSWKNTVSFTESALEACAKKRIK